MRVEVKGNQDACQELIDLFRSATHKFGVISAEKGYQNAADNSIRSAAMGLLLKQWGYADIYPAEGVFQGVTEASWLVTAECSAGSVPLKEDMEAISKAFDQDSFIWHAPILGKVWLANAAGRLASWSTVIIFDADNKPEGDYTWISNMGAGFQLLDIQWDR